MTREEAIKGLKVLRKDFSGYKPNEEMFDMAIEALKAEAVPQSEQYKKGFEDAKRAFLVEYARESENMRKRNAQLEVMLNAQKAISADRPTDSDLVSRAEAIEALRYAQHRFTVADEAGGMGSVKWSENVIYFAAAERVLTELPSADRPKGEWKTGEWIPVSERLPSDNKAVLVCDSGGNFFVGKPILTDTGYKWGIHLCAVWVDIEDGDAWMPLPEHTKKVRTNE